MDTVYWTVAYITSGGPHYNTLHFALTVIVIDFYPHLQSLESLHTGWHTLMSNGCEGTIAYLCRYQKDRNTKQQGQGYQPANTPQQRKNKKTLAKTTLNELMCKFLLLCMLSFSQTALCISVICKSVICKKKTAKQ